MLRMLVVLAVLAAGDAEKSKEMRARPLEALAKAGVGSVLSNVLDAPASVGGVRLNLRKQFLELTDLSIGNPKGFHAGDAITAKTIRVEADPKSLFSEEPLVRLIQVSGASVNSELNVSHGSNLKKLLDRVKRFEQSALVRSLPKKKWRIEKAIVEDGGVDMTTDLIERKTTHKPLDRIEMDFMGRDGKGMMANDAVAKVLEILIDKIGVFEGTGAAPLVNLLRK